MWLHSNWLLLREVLHQHHSLLVISPSTPGYSIFVVKGILPPCDADEALLVCPVDRKAVAKKQQEPKDQSEGTSSHGSESSGPGPPLPPPNHDEDDDWALAMAISASLQQQGII